MNGERVRVTNVVTESPNRWCRSGIRSRLGARSAAPGCETPRGVRARSRSTAPKTTVVDRTPRTAQAFTEWTVRVILEVLDRRRPINQLTALVSPDVLARIHTLASANLVPGRALGPASPVRVDVAMDDGCDAEIFARYRRGDRYFALAGRITHSRRHGWRLTALRIG